jgi:uncharacterized protein YebE (UPF0316 family)
MFEILLYIGLGFLLDVIVTVQMRAVYLARPYLASLLSIVITLISLLVIQHVIVSNNLHLIIAYAVGTGLGTLIGMKFKKREFTKRQT